MSNTQTKKVERSDDDRSTSEPEMTRKRESGKQARLEDLTRRVLDLPECDRLTLFEELRSDMGAATSQTADEQRIAAKRRGLRALEQVAEHLELDREGQRTLTGDQYNQTAIDLGIDVADHHLIEAFGSWRNAKVALIGERLPIKERSRQQVVREQRRRQRFEDQLSGVHAWLATDPEGLTRFDYEGFRIRENATRAPGLRKLVSCQTIVKRLGLPWSEVVREVKRGADYDHLAPVATDRDPATEEVKRTTAFEHGQAWEEVGADELRRRIRSARELLGWSQTGLAEEAGVNQSLVSKMERGEMAPSTVTTLRVAKAMNLSLDLLYRASADEYDGALTAAFAERRASDVEAQ